MGDRARPYLGDSMVLTGDLVATADLELGFASSIVPVRSELDTPELSNPMAFLAFSAFCFSMY
jgi:hypothetical protein